MSARWSDRLREWGVSEEQFIAAAQRGIQAAEESARTMQRVLKAEESLHVRVRYVTTAERPRTLTLPHDYQYGDASPHDEVAARTMFGDPAAASIGDYAEWMTSARNPTFTRVIVNRLWKKVFGAALFEPVDEITDNTAVHHPELLAFLERMMKDLDYDMKAFLAVLCRTRAYQRAATAEMPPAGEPYFFPGPVFRRMTAEQIWDSIAGQVTPDVDSYSPGLRRQLRAIRNRERVHDALANMPTDRYIAALIDHGQAAQVNAQETSKVRRELAQAMLAGESDRVAALESRQKALMKEAGAWIVGMQKNPQPEMEGEELLASFSLLERESNVQATVPEGYWPLITTLIKPAFPRQPTALDACQEGDWRERARAEYRQFLVLRAQWARASELASPAPRGHFLRDFGQSDREMIDNAANQASVPQALNLLNGPLADALTNRLGVLGAQVQAGASPGERVALLFEGLLTRRPDEEERRWMMEELSASGEKAGLQNIAWALLNTRQFLFVR